MKIENTITEINQEAIAKWKSEFGKVFKTTIDGNDFVWRKLKRKEYVEIMSDAQEDEDVNTKIYSRQERIAKAITIYPADAAKLIDGEAGIATSISDEALLKSGFNVGETEEL